MTCSDQLLQLGGRGHRAVGKRGEDSGREGAGLEEAGGGAGSPRWSGNE